MDPDLLLTSDSRFAESPALIAKTTATYDLLSEVAADDASIAPPVRVGLRTWQSADDPVLRRALDDYLIALKRTQTVGEPAGPGSGLTSAALRQSGFRPPGIGNNEPRFDVLTAPGVGNLRVLMQVDETDPWTSCFEHDFVEVLGNPGQDYALVAVVAAEVQALQQATDLLARTLPRVASSVFSHTSVVALVDGPDAFESATDRRIPRAVFINRQALSDPVRTAEALLHESVHQKLYDLQLLHQLYRSDYDSDTASTVSPPWHQGQAHWSFDRTLAACHVYIHLHAFFTALAASGAVKSEYNGELNASIQQAAERAYFLHTSLVPLAPQECAPGGVDLIAWLGRRLADIPVPSPAQF